PQPAPPARTEPPAEGAPAHPGPQFSTTQQPSPGPGGRGTALLIGGIAFAIVFLLVVGTTVAYLVCRPGDGGTPEAGTSPATESASVTGAGTDGPETSAAPTEGEGERC